MTIKKCKKCRADIVFLPTCMGKVMPCNAEEISVLTSQGFVVKGHKPHWGDCPGADELRKKDE